MVVGLRLAVTGSRDRLDATARAVIECDADAIIAFGPDRRAAVESRRRAAVRVDRGRGHRPTPQMIPEELKAEHNAVLERVRGGGQISFATRRIRRDGGLLDVRIVASALRPRR